MSGLVFRFLADLVSFTDFCIDAGVVRSMESPSGAARGWTQCGSQLDGEPILRPPPCQTFVHARDQGVTIRNILRPQDLVMVRTAYQSIREGWPAQAGRSSPCFS